MRYVQGVLHIIQLWKFIILLYFILYHFLGPSLSLIIIIQYNRTKRNKKVALKEETYIYSIYKQYV